MGSVHARIINLLHSQQCDFHTCTHRVTKTSAESALARSEDLKTGGKALLLKVGDDDFRLFVISAARKINSKAIKQFLGVRKVRFATPEELFKRTGLVPGSVPPFGEPVLPFRLYVDTSIRENDKIAFNAGSLTESVVMRVVNYLELADPEIFRFSD